MIIGRESCSRTQSEWGRPCSLKLGEANVRAVAFRELGSASLHILGVASLPNKVKPALEWEATTVGTVQTPRGERRQCAQKDSCEVSIKSGWSEGALARVMPSQK